jgi:hypothetical protein
MGSTSNRCSTAPRKSAAPGVAPAGTNDYVSTTATRLGALRLSGFRSGQRLCVSDRSPKRVCWPALDGQKRAFANDRLHPLWRALKACASRLVQLDKAIENPALDLDLSCRHPMITFFSAQHHLHALTHEFFRGERVPCFESPSRADLVRAKVAARGHEVCAPTSDSRGVLAKVHAPRYLTFLESAWEKWVALDPANATSQPFRQSGRFAHSQ